MILSYEYTMAFDGFITKTVISELNNVLIGGKINKILEPNKNEIILGIYNNGSNYTLDISSNPEFCRMCLTTHSKPNPQNAYNFCMLLRKYLINGKIVSISNYDLERTIEIKFEVYNELNDLVIRKLFIEIMSRQSNIILTNEKNIIIDTLKHFDNNVRELLPAHEYTFAPSTKISFINLKKFEEFQNIITNYVLENSQKNNNLSITKILTNTFIGFSKTLVKETINLLHLSEQDYTNSNKLEILYLYFKDLISNMGTSELCCKKVNDKDFSLFLDDSKYNINEEYVCEYYEKVPSLKINYFLDDFYFNKENNFIFVNSRNNLLKIVSASLKKIYKKLEKINLKLKECDEKDKFRLYGELLTANLYKINPNENLDSITLENYYDNNLPIEIPLDKKISIQKNIEKYFKKYNKLKNALSIVSAQKIEAEKELDYIESIVFNLSNSTALSDINEVYEEISENLTTKKDISKMQKNKNKKKASQNTQNKIDFETLQFENYTIYIGKNNIQNDYISLKISNPNDIWFHTQKIHGSHILLKNNENLDIEDIPENVLYKCACLAKENSKANNALNISVDYCYARYVKKLSGSKPGMVIYNNFKTIIVK